jgi:ribosomal protein L7/L12
MLIVLIILCALGVLVLISQGKKKADALVRMETRLDKMAAASGVRTGLEASEEVKRLAAKGDYVGALKAYRSETGADLERAKKIVDPLMNR